MGKLYLYLMLATLCSVSLEGANAMQGEYLPKKKIKNLKKPITLDVNPWWETKEYPKDQSPEENSSPEEDMEVQIPEEEAEDTSQFNQNQRGTSSRRDSLDKTQYVPMPRATSKERDLDKTQYVPMPKAPSKERDLDKTQYVPMPKATFEEQNLDVPQDVLKGEPYDKGYTVKERIKLWNEMGRK